jgi:hypothetical protein
MAVRESRIFICPALCGCELRMEATWVDDQAARDAQNRAVSYRNPVPGTIFSIAIEAVCAAHDALRQEPLPEDPYFTATGYLLIPEGRRAQWEAALSEAERLYVHLFRYSAQKLGPDTCGCRIAMVHDLSGREAARCVQHHRHTRRCREHRDDDDQHTEALENYSRKARVLARLRQAVPSVTDNDFVCTFDRAGGRRVLRLTVVGPSAAEKASLQAWCEANVGAGRVVVE